MFRRRLTFANVVAFVALFIALGGGVYAASKVNGKQIKNASIAGNKLKANTVGGGQVDEGTLGTVPNARSADTVPLADAAQTLAGQGPGSFVPTDDIKRIVYSQRVGSSDPVGTTTILQHGPLKLEGLCGANGSTAFALNASTSAPGAGRDSAFVTGTDQTSNAGSFLGSTPVNVYGDNANISPKEAVGTFIYNDATTTISVQLAILITDSATDGTCNVQGTSTRVDG